MEHKYEYGALSFPDHKAEVEIEDDGSVSVFWVDKADDGWGILERRVSFTGEQFDLIVSLREKEMAK